MKMRNLLPFSGYIQMIQGQRKYIKNVYLGMRGDKCVTDKILFWKIFGRECILHKNVKIWETEIMGCSLCYTFLVKESTFTTAFYTATSYASRKEN